MNDYIQQLKQYKKERWESARIPWTETDVRTLLETGKCENHSEHSCEVMLSKLCNDRATKNRFCGLVHEFNEKLNSKRKHVQLTKEEIKLIARHIVPYGRAKTSCCTYGTANKLYGDGKPSRQPWSYESKEEYEARTGKSAPEEETVIETVKEPVKEEAVEAKTPTEFELHAEAIKTMVSGGMEVEKIMKLLNIDEMTINAFMHLMTKYNF